MFGVYAGLRRGELIVLERRDIRNGVIVLRNKPELGFTLKDYEARQIPLEEELRPVVDALPAEGPALPSPQGHFWCPRNLSRLWEKTMRQLKLPPEKPRKTGPTRYGASFHELRHTYASHSVSSGLPLEIVGRLLGHTQVATTRRYAHLADSPLPEATERFAAMIGSRETADAVPLDSARDKR